MPGLDTDFAACLGRGSLRQREGLMPFRPYGWTLAAGESGELVEPSPRDTPAAELRALASAIERLTAESRISSVAMPAVQALCDYLALRARVMELEGRR